MSDTSPTASYYGGSNLWARLASAFASAGTDMNHLTTEDFSRFDEFHIGGSRFTDDLIAMSGVGRGQRLLDVGSGIGGPARHFAQAAGCSVHGIDLTPEFVEVAGKLSGLVGMGDATTFSVADALNLPFEEAEFDAVVTQHVQMNIVDKERFYREIARVLRPGGSFVFNEILGSGKEPLVYPVPWSQSEENSFLATPEAIRGYMESAGLQVGEWQDRSAGALEGMGKLAEVIAAKTDGSPDLLLSMGEGGPAKLDNLLTNLRSGAVCVAVGKAVKRS